METTNGHSATNGKSTHVRNMPTIPVAALGGDAHRFDRLFQLIKEVADLEERLEAANNSLDTEVASLGPVRLPTVLASLLRPLAKARPQAPVPPRSSVEGPEPKKEDQPIHPPESWKGRIMALMADGRERKSGVIVKALKATRHKSTVYHNLSELVTAGELVKPAYGFYRKA